MLSEGLAALETNIQLADSKEEEEVKKFSAQVSEDCPRVLKRIAECREQLDTGFLGDPDTPDEKVIKFLGQIEIDFEKAKARTVKLQEYQQILKLPMDDFEALDAVSADLNLKGIKSRISTSYALLYSTLLCFFVFMLSTSRNVLFSIVLFPLYYQMFASSSILLISVVG